MDTIITNSKNVHARLLEYCGYESEIIYPPVDIERFSPKDDSIEGVGNTQKRSMDCHVESHGNSDSPRNDDAILPSYHPTILPSDYFLSFARLSPPKRVDLIVEAFQGMPDQNLIFCYGKNDPMKEEILAKIRDNKNIFALESPNDNELIHLIQ